MRVFSVYTESICCTLAWLWFTRCRWQDAVALRSDHLGDGDKAVRRWARRKRSIARRRGQLIGQSRGGSSTRWSTAKTTRSGVRRVKWVWTWPLSEQLQLPTDPGALPLTAVSFIVSCNLGLAPSPQNCLIRRPRRVFFIGEVVALIFYRLCVNTRVSN